MPANDRVGIRVLAELRDAPLPGDWAERAACRGMRAEVFFPSRGEINRATAQGRHDICDPCPVLAHCRAYALRYPVLGWWGSMSEEERRQRRREEREAS